MVWKSESSFIYVALVQKLETWYKILEGESKNGGRGLYFNQRIK